MYSSPLKRFKDVFAIPPASPMGREKSRRLSPIRPSQPKSVLAVSDEPTRSESKDERSNRRTLPVVLEYLSKTKVEEDFSELCLELLSKDILPYNPYPWLVHKMISRNEIWRLSEKSVTPFEQVTDQKRFEIASRLSGVVVRPLSCDFVWGLRSLVSLVNSVEVWRHLWLLKDITPNPGQHQLAKDYTCQVIPAIIGPATFYGSVYNFIYSIEFKFEFIMVGPDVEMGMNVFLGEILNDVKDMEVNPLHILLRVYVPMKQNGVWMNKMWIYSDVVGREDELLDLLREAIGNRQTITAECLFSLDKEGSMYIHGQKQYLLTVIKTSNRVKDEDKIFRFTEAPYITLYEGIFTQQSHVESYLTINHRNFVEAENLNVRNEGQDAGVAGVGEVEHPTEADAITVQGESGLRPSLLHQRGSEVMDGNSNTKPHGDKILIDGFQQKNNEQEVDGMEVKNTIRWKWQQRMAALDLETEPWLVIHNALLLELLEGNSTQSELLTELHRAAHSRAAQLYSLMHLNRSLRELIYKYEPINIQDVPITILVSMFTAYKKAMMEFFDGNGAAENSILFSCRTNILRGLNSLEKFTESARAVTMETLRIIKDLHSYMYTLYMMLVKNVLDLCPLLKNLMQSLKSQFSSKSLVNSAHLGEDKFQITTIKPSPLDESPGVLPLKHGLENSTIMKHNEQVIDVQSCIRLSHIHSSFEAKQLVLMKYVVDTHLDQVWEEFLTELVSSGRYPENPGNQLISLLRQCSVKVDLCFETPQATMSHIKSSSVVNQADIGKYIYHLRQFNIYGLQTALNLLDPLSLQHTLHSVSPLFQKNFKFQEGPYKVAICSAITGSTTLYGRMDPYLLVIQLNEYCFIGGPKGCANEAMQLYIRITFEDILSKYKANDFVLDGVSFSGKLWSIDEVIYKKKGFALQMEQSFSAMEPVCLKLFILEDWRLVPVTKQLLFRYIVEGEPKSFPFYNERHYTLYHDIFLDADRAAFHLQSAGPQDGGNPFHSANLRSAIDDLDRDVSIHVKRSDWLEVCRLIFWRSQLTTKSSAVKVEVWRALHSVARRLDYVITLGQSLQDLVRNIMMAEEHQYLIETGERKQKQITRQPPLIEPGQQDVIMSQMLKAFRQKVLSVCQEDCCLAPYGIVTTISTKVDTLVEKDEESGQYLVCIDLKSIIIMDEILQMLSMLRDSLSYDVLLSSSAIQEVFRSVSGDSLPTSASLSKSEQKQFAHL